MSDSASIELKGVRVARDELPDSVAVDAVDWVIRPGEWWVVCGAPDSGKTSLLTTGAALNAPLSGTVRVFGSNYWNVAEPEQIALRRRIGFVFEGGGRLFSHMSVLENLVLSLQYHTNCDRVAAEERALELLARVELRAHAALAPARLSAALQRRVALARTLTEPVEVLFIDAPFAGLGTEDVRWWLRLLRGLAEHNEAPGERMSIVTSDYEFEAWLGWANRFGVLRDGSFQTIDLPEARAAARPLGESGVD